MPRPKMPPVYASRAKQQPLAIGQPPDEGPLEPLGPETAERIMAAKARAAVAYLRWNDPRRQMVEQYLRSDHFSDFRMTSEQRAINSERSSKNGRR